LHELCYAAGDGYVTTSSFSAFLNLLRRQATSEMLGNIFTISTLHNALLIKGMSSEGPNFTSLYLHQNISFTYELMKCNKPVH
jgi:hypothetical protein